MASKKLQFCQAVQGFCTSVAQATDNGNNASTIYNDRGYNPGGADPLTDEDIAELEIAATDVESAMLFFQNLDKLLNNQQVTTADYDATLNKLRNDL